MKAMLRETYGSPDVLQLREIEKPTPKAGEVLIKVHAASVNAADKYMLHGQPRMMRLAIGLNKPKNPRLGMDVAGVVEAVGEGVTRFKVGDAVYGDLSGVGMGAFAEYATAPETILAHKPANLTFEQAAAVPLAGVTALQGLRDQGKLQAGQRVLVNGASSGVGSFGVQIAKVMGAHVTAVCSTAKIEAVRALNPDAIIDYTKEDFTKSSQPYDLILDCAAFRPLADYAPIMTENGVYVLVGGDIALLFQSLFFGALRSMTGSRKFRGFTAKPNAADLETFNAWLEAGKITPAIGRTYSLGQLPAAIRDLEERRVQGKIAITV